MNKEQTRFIKFVLKAQWIFSKKYAKTFPHEYVVRRHYDPKEFEFIVGYIRDNGKIGKFFNKEFIYFEFEGYKYWTMGDPIEETIIINRERIKGGESHGK